MPWCGTGKNKIFELRESHIRLLQRRAVRYHEGESKRIADRA